MDWNIILICFGSASPKDQVRGAQQSAVIDQRLAVSDQPRHNLLHPRLYKWSLSCSDLI